MKKDNNSLASRIKSNIKKIFAVGLISTVSALGAGCYCPNGDDILRTRGPSFARGIAGHYLGEPDNYTLGFLCGYQIHDGHGGGTGDTLEWYSPEDTIYLEWAYGSLASVSVGANFAGKTDKGLKIGDNLEDVKEKYPNAAPREYSNSYWEDNGFSVRLDESEKVISMEVTYPSLF